MEYIRLSLMIGTAQDSKPVGLEAWPTRRPALGPFGEASVCGDHKIELRPVKNTGPKGG